MNKFTLPADGPLIAAEADILDPIGNAGYNGADMLVIPVSRLSPDFFKLSTGLRGRDPAEMLDLPDEGGDRRRHLARTRRSPGRCAISSTSPTGTALSASSRQRPNSRQSSGARLNRRPASGLPKMNEHQPALASSADTPLSSHSWGTEFRELFKLAWPLIVAQLARSALFTTDVIVLGWLGAKYVAAGALANALFVCVMLFGIGVVGAVAPMAAQAIGARDLRTVRRTVRSGIWLAIILFVLLFPLAWNIGPIYIWMGQDPELIALANIFIHAAIWSLISQFVFMALQGFLNAHGATRAILLITVAGVFVNLLANYVLVFGHWGFPALGIMGSGLATSIVNVAMLVIAIAYVQTNRRFRRYHIWHHFFDIDWQRLWALIQHRRADRLHAARRSRAVHHRVAAAGLAR